MNPPRTIWNLCLGRKVGIAIPLFKEAIVPSVIVYIDISYHVHPLCEKGVEQEGKHFVNMFPLDDLFPILVGFLGIPEGRACKYLSKHYYALWKRLPLKTCRSTERYYLWAERLEMSLDRAMGFNGTCELCRKKSSERAFWWVTFEVFAHAICMCNQLGRPSNQVPSTLRYWIWSAANDKMYWVKKHPLVKDEWTLEHNL